MDDAGSSLVKVVYSDEESASDYLDIAAGGKEASSSDTVRERSRETHAKVEAGLVAKLSWLPFLGASADVGAGVEASAAGRSILSKTLSNTILTDYLAKAGEDARVCQPRRLRVSAPEGSMAFMKMFTPYMVMLKLDDVPLDLAGMDDALAGAKGYYELLGEADDGSKRVLRFNIKAFRNNYGLTDLARMQLVFHGVLVGHTPELALSMEAEMSGGAGGATVTAAEIIDGAQAEGDDLLEVYDVILAGVEHVG